MNNIEPPEEKAPAVRCSYCKRLYQDHEKHKMGFETDEWAVCFKCSKKAFDKVVAE